MPRGNGGIQGGAGWCVGQILRRNKDAWHKVRNKTMDFSAFHEIGEQEADYALSVNNYHNEGTGNADYQYWVLLEEGVRVSQ